MNDPRKQSIYMEVELINELHQEAARQQRTYSWLMQHAWAIAKPEIQKYRPKLAPRP